MKLNNLLQQNNLDGILLTNKYNLRYFTSFTGTTGFALVTKTGRYFFSDFRYKEQATNQVTPRGFEFVLWDRTMKSVAEFLKKDEVKRLGIEDQDITLSYYNNLKTEFEGVELVSLEDKVSKTRMIKTEEEIENIKEAVRIADIAFSQILEKVKEGVKERDLSAEIEYIMKLNGAEDKSFDFIVASGYRSAMPHGVASDKTIGKNEFVTFDFGCYYNGYASDITRTIFFGDEITEKHKEIYNTVLEAQLLAISKAKAGMKASELDKVARDYITEKGYGEYFGHGLGHALGLEIHEQPFVSKIGDIVLEENMVVTIEPGIYIEGFGGVRIEDDVIIKKDGCEVLNKSPKELLILK